MTLACLFRSVFSSLLITAAGFSTQVFAQAPGWDWAVSFGGSQSDYTYSVAVDGFGNVLTTGYFLGSVDLDPGPGVHYLSSPNGLGIFVSKLDASGQFLWARAFPGTGYNVGASIAVDKIGDVYVAGHFSGPVDFDPGPGVSQSTAIGGQDIYLAKFTSSGSLVWMKAMGSVDHEGSASLAVDNIGAGAIYFTGDLRGTVDMDPGPGVVNASAVGNTDVYVAKMDTAGNLLWIRTLGGSDADHCRELAVDESLHGSVYTVGSFEGVADFDPDTVGVHYLTSVGAKDLFLSKLDNTGALLWAIGIGGTGYDEAISLSVDIAGDHSVYVTGSFQGVVDMDPGPGVFNLVSAGDLDIFVAKYSSSGALIWAKNMGGTNHEKGLAVVVDPLGSGHVTTAGYYNGTADMDPDQAATFSMNPVGNYDIFVSRLDGSGNFQWAMGVGGPSADMALALTGGVNGEVYMCGSYYSTQIAFGATTLNNNFAAGGSGDVFIAKLQGTLTSVPDSGPSPSFSIHPNPTRDLLYIQGDVGRKGAVEITDVSGRVVLQERLGTTINVAHLSRGVYMLRLMDDGNILHQQKFIIER